MNAGTQRKVSIGILAVAFAALGVDRFLLGSGGPSAASAQQAAEVTPELPSVPEQLAVASPRLAERLDTLATAEPELLESVPDLFYRPTLDDLVVTSIIGRGDRGAAVVNGRMLRVDETDKKSGATLIDVQPGVVTFRLNDREIQIFPERRQSH